MLLLQKIKNFLLIIILFFTSNCEKGEIYPWSEDSLENILVQNSDKMILVDFETDW